MKAKLSLVVPILLLTTFVLVSCSNSSEGDSSDSGHGTKITKADSEPKKSVPQRVYKDCETQWTEKVAEIPVGQVKAYDIVEVTTGSGSLGMDGRRHSHSRDKFISATDEVIVSVTRWEYFQPALGVVEGESRLTKENFMITCSPNDGGHPEADPDAMARQGITILADQKEVIEVIAGKFETHFQQIRVRSELGLADEVMGDHWMMNGDTVVVKEKIVVKQRVDDGASQMVSITEKELIEYK